MTNSIRAACLVLAIASPLFAEDKPAWDVNAPPLPLREITIDTGEGTWLDCDVSPDGLSIAFHLLGDIYEMPITGGDAKALTHGMAWDMQPVYSPDGKRIAFTSDRDGGDNLYVMDRDGSNVRALTKETFRLLNEPAWDPSGQWVAGRKHFTGRRSLGAGEIWLYHVSGSDGVPMTTKPTEQKDVGEPAFSPDGKYVYFSLDATPGPTFEYSKDSNAGIYAIQRLDRKTGEIVTLISGPGGACRPTPSPDGKSLAYVRRVRFDTQLWLYDLESGAKRMIAAGLERDMQETWAIHGVYPRMAFLPDGKSIVYYASGSFRRTKLENGETAQIPLRVKDTRQVSSAVRFPQTVAPDRFHVKAIQSVRVAPDGSKVAYQALGHIYVKDLPNGAPRRLTAQTSDFEFDPSFSRDSKSIAFTSWNDDTLGSVRIADIATGATRTLTQQPGMFVEPVFSPDGATVVYRKTAGGSITSPRYGLETGIFAVDSAGRLEPRLVTRSGTNPQFGGDGDRVYLTNDGAKGETDEHSLTSIELDGSDARTHATSENAVEFALSPDGKYLAFVERFQAYVATFPPTGRSLRVGPNEKSIPVARVSKDAGEFVQFSGDSKTLHWALGPQLFSRPLTDSFAFLDGAPNPLPEPTATGVDITFDAPTAKPTTKYALVNARIITMKGDEVIESGYVLVDGNRITAVGSAESGNMPDLAGYEMIDCGRRTIMPGIIDVHAHGAQGESGITPQRNWVNACNLAFGVTTVHDPSANTHAIFAASELERSGAIVAPRIFSTGTILYGAYGSFKAEIETLDDAKAHLKRLKAIGAFSVKSYNQPRRDQRQKILAAARELEMMVVPEGGSTFQHNMTMVIDGHTGIEHSLPVQSIYMDVVQAWKGSGVGYTPTLIVGYGGIWGENYWYDVTNVWENAKLLRFTPREVIDPRSRRRTKAPIEEYNHLRSAGICRHLVNAGERVQLGAHGQLAGLGAHWELWMLTQGGLTNHQALRAATLDGAIYIGLDRDLGSLEPGKLADLIVLDGNPLEEIRISELISNVMKNGVLYDGNTLAAPGGTAPQFFFEKDGANATGHAGSCGCEAGHGAH